MRWTLVLLLAASAPLFAEEGSVPPPNKPLNLNVLPPKPEKHRKSKSVPKLTPMSVVCDYQGTTWVTKSREDEDRCKMRGGKLRVAAGDGHQLPDMQSIPSKHHPTRLYPPTNSLDPVNQNPHLQNDPSASKPADGSE